MRYREAVVLVKDYRPDISTFLSIVASKSFRQRYWQMVERRDSMVRQTQCRVQE